jgi:hypothetical protein
MGFFYPSAAMGLRSISNKPASANRAVTLLFHILQSPRPVAEPARSADNLKAVWVGKT